jgi:hypothetical protein
MAKVIKSLLYLALAGFIIISGQSCIRYKLCPIPGCEVRMLHQHQGVTFRGQPWWKLNQNPKTGDKYVMHKDRHYVMKETWWTRNFGKKKEKPKEDPNKLPGIKARDPNERKQKDFDDDGEPAFKDDD